MQIDWFGPNALLVQCDTRAIQNQQRLATFANELKHHGHVHDGILGDGNLVLYGEYDALAHIKPHITQLWDAMPYEAIAPTHHEIIMTYDTESEDMRFVCDATGLRVDEVIKAHLNSQFAVQFFGFLPGFAYLTGLDPRLHCKRRETPRTHVATGSVAIASHYCGIYPADSAGGWHILGHTESRLFDATREPAVTLSIGDTVRFTKG